MKLTSKDFDIHKCTETESYCFISRLNPENVIEEILDNQKFREYWTFEILDGISLNQFKKIKEKAEKWDELQNKPTEQNSPAIECTHEEMIQSVINDPFYPELKQMQQENKRLKEIVERLRKLISHLSQLYLDNKLEDTQSLVLLLILRDCVLNGKFDDSMKSWEEVLTTKKGTK